MTWRPSRTLRALYIRAGALYGPSAHRQRVPVERPHGASGAKGVSHIDREGLPLCTASDAVRIEAGGPESRHGGWKRQNGLPPPYSTGLLTVGER